MRWTSTYPIVILRWKKCGSQIGTAVTKSRSTAGCHIRRKVTRARDDRLTKRTVRCFSPTYHSVFFAEETFLRMRQKAVGVSERNLLGGSKVSISRLHDATASWLDKHSGRSKWECIPTYNMLCHIVAIQVAFAVPSSFSSVSVSSLAPHQTPPLSFPLTPISAQCDTSWYSPDAP
jgi:hypothetical protein